MAALSGAQLADLCRRHFPAGQVPQTGELIQVTAFAVARAESGGRPDALGDRGNSCGLWQIDRAFHPQFSAAYLLNPENNATAAAAISSGGLNWNPWCSWEPTACGGAGNGSYRAHLPEARAALASSPGPTPQPDPGPGSKSGALPLIMLAGAGALLLLAAKRRAAAPR